MIGDIKLDNSWKRVLCQEFQKEYMLKLKEFLISEYKAGKIIYPKGSEYFNALNLTPLDRVKVVIIGQDPYHGEGQAHGLCFSVRPNVPIPPSLRNIFKELYNDLGIPPANHGCLEYWARQGVLLLNSVLTVVKNQPGSHRNKGWEIFTDKIIEVLNEQNRPIVFLLWGKYAHEKTKYLNTSKHLVLKAAHPSPYSATNGFLGCRHFSKTNTFLQYNNYSPIDWKLF